MLVAVTPHHQVVGFPASPGKTARRVVRKMALEDALRMEHRTDAFILTYVVDDEEDWQYRIKKEAVACGMVTCSTQVMMADIDNVPHEPWTQEGLEHFKGWILERLKTEGLYTTTRGYRLVQPLTRALDVRDVELRLQKWHLELQSRGIQVDLACKDWTRHYRAPRVVKDGRRVTPAFELWSKMAEMDPPEIPVWVAQKLAGASAGGGGGGAGGAGGGGAGTVRALPTAHIEWVGVGEDVWHDRVEKLAGAVRMGVHERWHEMYLALSGALMRANVPGAQVPALIRWIATLAGSVKPESHEQSARATVLRITTGAPTSGLTRLRRDWPSVADAFDWCFRTKAEVKRDEREEKDEAHGRTIVPREQAAAAMTHAMLVAPDGVTLIQASCGLGKTQAVMAAAVERAKGEAKTSISVDKNELAEQIVSGLRKEGVTVARVFGPLSVTGEKECKLRDKALPLVEGGLSMQWEFCEGRGNPDNRCPYYEGCSARNGRDGPEDAHVIVGTHAMLNVLRGEAGAGGIVAIDEPPPLLTHESFSKSELDHTINKVRVYFDPKYATLMLGVLRAVRTWMEAVLIQRTDEDEEAVGVDFTWLLNENAPVDWLELIGADDEGAIVGQVVAAAIGKMKRGSTPPLRAHWSARARGEVSIAADVGAVSRVLELLARAVVSPTTVSLRLEGDACVVSMANVDYVKTLRRNAPTLVMDANIDLHLEAITRVVDGTPSLERFDAEDGAPIERVHIRTSSVSRAKILGPNNFIHTKQLERIFQAIRRWLGAGAPGLVGLITFKPVADWLADRPEDPSFNFGPDYPVMLGHYGALRGLDKFKACSALVTVGDPWMNLNTVESEVRFLFGGSPVEREALFAKAIEGHARAELEQAHGRLRTIWRSSSARAAHVGALKPSGPSWGRDRVKETSLGDWRVASVAAPTMSVLELAMHIEKMGGPAAAARAWGRNVPFVVQMLRGSRPIPQALALMIREVAHESAQKCRTNASY